MYDGIDPNTVPAGAQVYAGYVNGNWPSYNALVAKFPNAQHVTITVFSGGDAQVLDVEQGDAAAVDVPAWLTRQRARGQVRPTVYCSRIGAPGYGWQNVIDACHAANVALPDFWIADYTSGPHALSLNGINAVAVQWTDHGGYDESVINDPTWPAAASQEDIVHMPTLHKGDKGDFVYTLQGLLNGKCKQNIKVTGVYDDATATGVKNVKLFFHGPNDDPTYVGDWVWKTLLAI